MTRGSALLALTAIFGCQFARPPDVEGTDDAPTQQYELSITVAGPGAGFVAVTPGDFICSSGTCTRAYDVGSDLSIAATPTTALDAVGTVGGDCVSLPCTLTLAGPRAIDVSFKQLTCAPNLNTCVGGRFTSCGPDGEYVTHDVPNGNGEGLPATLTMHDYDCPLGCHATENRCAEIDTQMEFNAILDLPAVSDTGRDVVLPAAGNPPGTITIDTSDFDATLHEIHVTDTNGQSLRIPAEVVTQPPPAPEVLVIAARTFTLRSGSTLQVRGARAFAVLAHYDLVVGGTVDASAEQGGIPIGGPGGFRDAMLACTGRYLNGVSGGGSNACNAGNGSNGAMRGDLMQVVPPALAGGCPGGGKIETSVFQFGGAAGGALALVSRTKARLGPTSLLDASGGHGWGGTMYATGGGAGGTIVIQAPTLLIASGAVIAARGGSGGASGPTNSAMGQEGPVQGSVGAAGGSCAGCGTGGTGGWEGGCGGTGNGSGTALAGGGGGVGQCRTFTRSPPVVPSGSMRIANLNAAIAVRAP